MLPIQFKLDESTQGNTDLFKKVPDEIQLFRTGVYYHPEYGKMEITSDILKKMVINFSEKVRGIDIALDYKHESQAEAAAWFTEVYTKENDTQLWGRIRWTEKGKNKILNEEFKYISPDFTFEYTDNQTQKKFGPVLLGAGLTNRPFIKNMQPITLSEENTMNELEKLKAENELLKAEIEKLKAGKGEVMEATDAEKKYKEAEAKLAEEKAKNDKLLSEKKLAEDKGKFDVMLAEGKVVEAQRESFMKGDTITFASLAKSVNFKNEGHGGSGDDGKTLSDAEDELERLIAIKLSENKDLSYSEATIKVLSENKKLNEEYNKKFN